MSWNSWMRSFHAIRMRSGSCRKASTARSAPFRSSRRAGTSRTTRPGGYCFPMCGSEACGIARTGSDGTVFLLLEKIEEDRSSPDKFRGVALRRQGPIVDLGDQAGDFLKETWTSHPIVDPQGWVWGGTQDGLAAMSPDGRQIVSFAITKRLSRVTTVAANGPKVILVGGASLWQFDPAVYRQSPDAELLQPFAERSLAAKEQHIQGEFEGFLWVRKGWTDFEESQATATDYLKILRDPDGDIAFLMGLREIRESPRRLSELGLAQLKTDRSFSVLGKLLQDKDPRVRYQSMDVLSNFRQPRVRALLIEVLAHDVEPRNRAGAAVRLEDYPQAQVKTALLQALKGDDQVAQAAAFALAGLQVEEAVAPTVGRLRSDRRDLDRNYLRCALSRYTSQKARARIAELAKGLSQEPSTPTSGEKASAGARPEELVFRVSLDAKTYRLGDPIAIDFALENRSASPARTIPPLATYARPTTAYGIRLERLSDPPATLLESDPTAADELDVFGPPLRTLRRGETYSCATASMLGILPRTKVFGRCPRESTV